FHRQDPSGVNIVSSNAIGRQPSFSSPPPIPTAPKPSSSTLPPLPPKPSNTNVIEGNVSDTDSEESYVNEEEEKEEKEEDEEEEEEEEGEGGEEKEDEGEDEKEDTYINDEPSKKASPYQNAGPSRGVQPSLPPRNTQDKKRISQSPKQTIATPQPATPQPKHKKEGFFKNILGKGDKTKKKYPSEDTRAIPNISETQPPQTNIRPLPVPRNRLPNSNQTSNTPSSDTVNSQSSNPPQTSDSDDDDDIYVNDTFYEKIGLDTKDQERIYMKISPNNEESTAGTRPITNVVDYMLDNEQKYITTVNKLADGKKFFPLVIQPYLGSIEKLPALHKELYEALTASKKSTAKMATAFISRKEKFIVYHNIIVNALVVEKHLKNTSDYEKAKIKDMHEPLRQARKRLHFYFMHLEGMLPSATEQERKKIQEAVDILKDYYKNADTGVLIKSIRKSPLQLTLYKPLHLHSLVYVSGPQMNNKEYRVLLFEEIIIVALPIDDDHEYQLDIRMEVVKLNDNTTNPKTLILHVDYGGVRGMEKYIFRFTDEKVKQGWKNEILSIHRRYMEKIRGSTTS
ncbi:unnamed protein product, partial [Meganyctiphanes norvegica]